jgi:hypothetical protein
MLVISSQVTCGPFQTERRAEFVAVVAAVHKVIDGVISCQGTVPSLKVTEIETIKEQYLCVLLQSFWKFRIFVRGLQCTAASTLISLCHSRTAFTHTKEPISLKVLYPSICVMQCGML